MAVPSPRLSWYRSFYWRIGITFVAFVVVFLIIAGHHPRAGFRARPRSMCSGPLCWRRRWRPMWRPFCVREQDADLSRSPQVSISARSEPRSDGRCSSPCATDRCFRIRTARCPRASGSPRCRRSASGPSRSPTPCAPSPPPRCSSTIGSSVWCWCWCGRRGRPRRRFLANSASSCHCQARSS